MKNTVKKQVNSLGPLDFINTLKPIVVKNYILRKEGENFVFIFNVHSPKMILNKPSKDILTACNGKNSLAKISEMIASKYNISFEKAAADTGDFIYKLIQNGFASFQEKDFKKIIDKTKK